MASAKETKESSSILNCPICLEQFKTPVYLPCLHTFCELCLETLIDSMKSDGNVTRNTFNCPVCRMKCDLKDDKSQKSTGQFPFNYLISALMSNKEKSPRKLLSDNCDPCQRVGSKVKAVSWCCDCNEAYCTDCSKGFHNRVRNAHSHTVTRIKDDRLVPHYLGMKAEEPCLKHKGRPVEVICQTHFTLCCAVCLTDEHLECTDVKPIDEIISDFSENKFVDRFIQNFKFLLKDIQNIIEIKEKQIREIEDQKETSIAYTEKVINGVMEMLVKLKKDVRENVSAKQIQMKRSRELQIDTIKSVQLNMTQSVKLLEMLSCFENPRQSFYLLLKMQPNFSEHLTLFRSQALDDDSTSLSLNIDPMIVALSNKNTLSCLVKRNVTSLATSESRIAVEERLLTLDDSFYDIVSKNVTRFPIPLNLSDEVDEFESGLFSPFENTTIPRLKFNKNSREKTKPHNAMFRRPRMRSKDKKNQAKAEETDTRKPEQGPQERRSNCGDM